MCNKKVLSIIVAATLITGCAGSGPKETGGTLIGGATGALIGAQFGGQGTTGQLVGVALGTMLGAALGGEVGRRMDAKDKELADNTARYALENEPDNRQSTWHNPNNNHSGRFVVVKTEEFRESNKVCRDFVHTVIIDGRKENVHGRACRDVRDPRAHWTVQS